MFVCLYVDDLFTFITQHITHERHTIFSQLIWRFCDYFCYEKNYVCLSLNILLWSLCICIVITGCMWNGNDIVWSFDLICKITLIVNRRPKRYRRLKCAYNFLLIFVNILKHLIALFPSSDRTIANTLDCMPFRRRNGFKSFLYIWWLLLCSMLYLQQNCSFFIRPNALH